MKANEQKKTNISRLAQTIGSEADAALAKTSRWWLHSNRMQKFMLLHPEALGVIKTIIEDDELLHQCREQLAGEDVTNCICALEEDTKKNMTGAMKQEELISTLQSALKAIGKETRLIDSLTSDPERLTRCAVYEQLGGLIWMMRQAQCKKINPIHSPILYQRGAGTWVRVRPCGDEYGDKTYLGMLLGDFPLACSFAADENDPDTLNLQFTFNNPAIYIPDLRKTIFGAESWWSEIEKPEDLEHISDIDINNVWYVRALRDLNSKTTFNNVKEL